MVREPVDETAPEAIDPLQAEKVCAECHAAQATVRLGYHGFDGSGVRFITTRIVCEGCAGKTLRIEYIR